MRVVAVIGVIVQLLLRGVAAPHSHAQNGPEQPADHANRPHVHVKGHSYSLGHQHPKHQHPKHQHPKHEHPHRHDGRHKDRHTPATPQPTDPSPLPSDHDHNAVYVGVESVIRSTDRIQLPEPTEAGWVLAELDSGKIAGLPDLIAGSSIGPPGKSPGTKLDLLPHLLRI